MIGTIAKLLIRIGALGLIAMTAIIGWQVLGRFVLASSPSWTEQASLILMVWYVMFGAAAGVYEGFHIRIALLEEKLGRRSGPLLRGVALIMAATGIFLLIYGSQLCWAVRDVVVPSVGISRAVVYIPLPIAGLLMAVFALPQAFGSPPPSVRQQDGEVS